MSTYIPYVTIHYVKKKEIDSTHWHNSCDMFSKFQEAFVKKVKIDINIYSQLKNQDGQMATVTVFPPEITDVFGEETLEGK